MPFHTCYGVNDSVKCKRGWNDHIALVFILYTVILFSLKSNHGTLAALEKVVEDAVHFGIMCPSAVGSQEEGKE